MRLGLVTSFTGAGAGLTDFAGALLEVLVADFIAGAAFVAGFEAGFLAALVETGFFVVFFAEDFAMTQTFP